MRFAWVIDGISKSLNENILSPLFPIQNTHLAYEVCMILKANNKKQKKNEEIFLIHLKIYIRSFNDIHDRN